MTCLLVTSIFAPINGGSAVVYENLCTYMPEGSIIVLAPKYHCGTGEYLDGWAQHDAKANYPIHRINLLRPKIVGARSIWHSLFLLFMVDYPLRIKVFFTALRLVKKYKVETICIGELHSLSWLGSWLRKVHKLKVINYIHGEEVTTEENYRSYQRTRAKYLNVCDAIVAVSSFTREYLINRFRLAEDKVVLIPNGVDLKKFNTEDSKPSSNELRQRYKLEGKIVFVSVGRLVSRKGFDFVIKSLPRVISKNSHVHYLIVGTGPLREYLESQVSALNLKQHVTFTGKVSDEELVPHYKIGEAFIMPNRTMPDGDTEGFGLVFLEANACGVPVIGGRAGGAQEAVIDGLNGISVDGYDLENIEQAMLDIIEKPSYAEALKVKGLAHAKKMSFESCAKQFLKLNDKLSGELR
jgi:phosphatidylinositol alpha-1,6-mannosyltransferase